MNSPAKLISFTIPGQPQGKGRAKVSTRGGFARAYTPEKTAAYENLIKIICKEAMLKENTEIIQRGQAVSIAILAAYPLPKSFSSVKEIRALKGQIKPLVKPDIDNVIKVICDALNGITYADDSQIVMVNASKFYSNEPRVEVVLTEVKLQNE